MISADLVDEADLDEIDEEAERLMDEVVDEAKAAAEPSQDNLLTDVYVSY